MANWILSSYDLSGGMCLHKCSIHSNFFLIFLFISSRALGMTNCNSGNPWNAGKKEALVCDSYIQTLKMFILLSVMLEHDDIYWDG